MHAEPEPPHADPDPLARRDRPAVTALIVANVLPIVGVLFFGWDLGNVLILFWAESAVIGIYNVIKMITVGGLLAIPIAVFFTVHYGGFMAGHLVFILVLGNSDGFFREPSDMEATRSFAEAIQMLIDPTLWIALLGLFVSHGVSFVQHFLLGPERPARATDLMGAPYIRIVVMHLTIIFGAALTLALGSNLALLVLLIVLKLGVDLWAHRREHRKAAQAKS